MIHLTKGQPLFENPSMVVYDPTGYYNDDDSVICSAVFAPEDPVCRYEAKFIAYGGIVYSITDPEKLMEEIVKINPENLFGKNKEEVAIDKMVENIETVDSSTPIEGDENTAVTVPVVPENTEPAVIPAEVVEPVVVENASSTPEVITENPVVEQVIPAINNVIEELNQISDIVEATTADATSTEVSNLIQ